MKFCSIRVALAALAAVAAAGCTGSIAGMGPDGDPPASSGGRGGRSGVAGHAGGGMGGSGGTSDDPTTQPKDVAKFACDPGAKPAVARLRKLNAAQYGNTLKDLLAWATKSASIGQAAFAELAGALGALPKDYRPPVSEDPHGAFRRMDQDMTEVQVEAMYQVAKAAGVALTSAQRLGAVVGACATDASTANDAACIDDFINGFGERAMRRPLEADDKAFFRGVYGTSNAIDPAAFADVITVMLSTPQALYLMEHGDAAVAGTTGVYKLTPFELASRLSYHFWGTMPDDQLWAAAKSGSLASPDELSRQIERLFSDARTRANIDEFYSDWLKLEDLPAFNGKNDDPVFKAFAGDLLPSANFRQGIVDDALDLLRYYTWTRPGAVKDVLTSDRSFARSAEVAKVYGAAAWMGTGEPPAVTAGPRPGLLTRAALVASASGNTRPIMKGVFIRRSVLCDPIPPPPENANAVPPQISATASTREVVETITEQAAPCNTCHKQIINGLGFATENFDALGRLRSEERLFDGAGHEVARKPIDTRSVPQVTTGDKRESSGIGDVVAWIEESGKAEACLARNYFRFAFARWDDVDQDACTLEPLRQAVIADGGGLAAMFKAVATTPAFTTRVFE